MDAVWKVFDGHTEHCRATVFESLEIANPALHVGCAMHCVLKCEVVVWYVFAWQTLQLPAVVTDAPTSRCPASHGVVAVHAVFLCDVDA